MVSFVRLRMKSWMNNVKSLLQYLPRWCKLVTPSGMNESQPTGEIEMSAYYRFKIVINNPNEKTLKTVKLALGLQGYRIMYHLDEGVVIKIWVRNQQMGEMHKVHQIRSFLDEYGLIQNFVEEWDGEPNFW